MDGTPIVTIIGELVALGPQRRDLVHLYQRWLNDFAVMAPLGESLRPVTYEADLAILQETDAARDQAWFTIYERATMQPLGITGLRDIDHAQRRAEFVIFIGERNRWGHGLGTETTRLILDYGFSTLGLHTIMLRVYSFNERGIRAYRRAGFREIGRWRQAYHLADHAYDVIFMDCLRSEFDGRALPTHVSDGMSGQPP